MRRVDRLGEWSEGLLEVSGRDLKWEQSSGWVCDPLQAFQGPTVQPQKGRESSATRMEGGGGRNRFCARKGAVTVMDRWTRICLEGEKKACGREGVKRVSVSENYWRSSPSSLERAGAVVVEEGGAGTWVLRFPGWVPVAAQVPWRLPVKSQTAPKFLGQPKLPS